MKYIRKPMELIITEDYPALSRAGAELVAGVINATPNAAIVVATGDTPMGMYRELAEQYRNGTLQTERLRIFQLDAYLGLAPADRRSLYGWMLRSFIEPLGIRERNIVRLPGDAPDPAAVCAAYDQALDKAGGFDLAILGLGPNGHLGFNEPPADPHSPTRMIDLTEESIESNARYWGGRDLVPRQALTCGMAGLLGARRTLLVVSGARKYSILHRTVEGPVSPDVPASYLQTIPGVTVIADRAAWEGT